MDDAMTKAQPWLWRAAIYLPLPLGHAAVFYLDLTLPKGPERLGTGIILTAIIALILLAAWLSEKKRGLTIQVRNSIKSGFLFLVILESGLLIIDLVEGKNFAIQLLHRSFFLTFVPAIAVIFPKFFAHFATRITKNVDENLPPSQ